MPAPRPDFRTMTPDDLRRGISDLNGQSRRLRDEMNRVAGRFALGQMATVGAAGAAMAVFPPLAAGVIAAGLMHGVDQSAQSAVLRARLAEVESLRKSFKTVWRARPGRRFYDIDARGRRESARRAEKRRQQILQEYKRKFGRFE